MNCLHSLIGELFSSWNWQISTCPIHFLFSVPNPSLCQLCMYDRYIHTHMYVGDAYVKNSMSFQASCENWTLDSHSFLPFKPAYSTLQNLSKWKTHSFSYLSKKSCSHSRFFSFYHALHPNHKQITVVLPSESFWLSTTCPHFLLPSYFSHLPSLLGLRQSPPCWTACFCFSLSLLVV